MSEPLERADAPLIPDCPSLTPQIYPPEDNSSDKFRMNVKGEERAAAAAASPPPPPMVHHLLTDLSYVGRKKLILGLHLDEGHPLDPDVVQT